MPMNPFTKFTHWLQAKRRNFTLRKHIQKGDAVYLIKKATGIKTDHGSVPTLAHKYDYARRILRSKEAVENLQKDNCHGVFDILVHYLDEQKDENNKVQNDNNTFNLLDKLYAAGYDIRTIVLPVESDENKEAIATIKLVQSIYLILNTASYKFNSEDLLRELNKIYGSESSSHLVLYQIFEAIKSSAFCERSRFRSARLFVSVFSKVLEALRNIGLQLSTLLDRDKRVVVRQNEPKALSLLDLLAKHDFATDQAISTEIKEMDDQDFHKLLAELDMRVELRINNNVVPNRPDQDAYDRQVSKLETLIARLETLKYVLELQPARLSQITEQVVKLCEKKDNLQALYKLKKAEADTIVQRQTAETQKLQEQADEERRQAAEQFAQRQRKAQEEKERKEREAEQQRQQEERERQEQIEAEKARERAAQELAKELEREQPPVSRVTPTEPSLPEPTIAAYARVTSERSAFYDYNFELQRTAQDDVVMIEIESSVFDEQLQDLVDLFARRRDHDKVDVLLSKECVKDIFALEPNLLKQFLAKLNPTSQENLVSLYLKLTPQYFSNYINGHEVPQFFVVLPHVKPENLQLQLQAYFYEKEDRDLNQLSDDALERYFKIALKKIRLMSPPASGKLTIPPIVMEEFQPVIDLYYRRLFLKEVKVVAQLEAQYKGLQSGYDAQKSRHDARSPSEKASMSSVELQRVTENLRKYKAGVDAAKFEYLIARRALQLTLMPFSDQQVEESKREITESRTQCAARVAELEGYLEQEGSWRVQDVDQGSIANSQQASEGAQELRRFQQEYTICQQSLHHLDTQIRLLDTSPLISGLDQATAKKILYFFSRTNLHYLNELTKEYRNGDLKYYFTRDNYRADLNLPDEQLARLNETARREAIDAGVQRVSEGFSKVATGVSSTAKSLWGKFRRGVTSKVISTPEGPSTSTPSSAQPVPPGTPTERIIGGLNSTSAPVTPAQPQPPVVFPAASNSAIPASRTDRLFHTMQTTPQSTSAPPHDNAASSRLMEGFENDTAAGDDDKFTEVPLDDTRRSTQLH